MSCECCESGCVSRFRVRANLEYDCCQDCDHCVKVAKQGLSADFESAQSNYFGDRTQLVTEAIPVFEEEILEYRKRMVVGALTQGSLVTEVGPGSGFFAAWLQATGYRVQLVEHSKALASWLSAMLGVKIFVGDFLPGAFDLELGDAFCSFHVVEHVVDPVMHLAAGRETVRPGGMAFVATPNSRSWQQRVFRRLSPNYDSAHLRVFSKESLINVCERAGWLVEAGHTPEYAVGWLRVVTKAVRVARGQDEETTAGSYATHSKRFAPLFSVVGFVLSPLRFIQSRAGGGNEIFLILRNPS